MDLNDAKTLNELEIFGQLWVVIRVFELTLRSFVHATMVERHKDLYWWRNPSLINLPHLSRFSNSWNIEGMTLSSLVLLFSSAYTRLWRDTFQDQLSRQSTIDRRTMHMKLEYIRKFRNIIAHHGYLKKRNVDKTFENMHSILHAIEPSAADWLDLMKIRIDESFDAWPNNESW